MGTTGSMEFWNTVINLLGRKRVLIPCVVVALGLAAVAYLITPVSYVSSSTLVVTTTQYGSTESRDPAAPTGLSNPLLNFNDSLRTASAILIQSMNTKDVSTSLGARGSTSLLVNDGRTNPDLLGLEGPFVYVEAKSRTPAEARRVVEEAQALMREKLRDWQSRLNAPSKTFVSLNDVVPPSAPEPSGARRTKLAILALIAGFVLSVGVAYARHRVRARRFVPLLGSDCGETTPQPPHGDHDRPRRPLRSPALVPELGDRGGEPDLASDLRATPVFVGPSVHTSIRFPKR